MERFCRGRIEILEYQGPGSGGLLIGNLSNTSDENSEAFIVDVLAVNHRVYASNSAIYPTY